MRNNLHNSRIFNKMLDGKLVEGQHEKVISKEMFLNVHNVREETGTKYGILHKREHDNISLKVFMKCEDCGSGYTGYIVKAKNIWYYKCRTTGYCNNKNSKEVNNRS